MLTAWYCTSGNERTSTGLFCKEHKCLPVNHKPNWLTMKRYSSTAISDLALGYGKDKAPIPHKTLNTFPAILKYSLVPMHGAEHSMQNMSRAEAHGSINIRLWSVLCMP